MRELLLVFARLSVTSFGGPSAHVALMREELVVRRGWLSDQDFLDLLGAAQLLPGPTSTELALHIGWRRGGLLGLVAAGVGFIVPAFLVTLAVAVLYVAQARRPELEWLLHGVKPVILAVVVQAIWGLIPTAARSRWLKGVGLGAGVAALWGVHELLVLVVAGLACALRAAMASSRTTLRCGVGAFAPLVLTAAPAVGAVGLLSLFGVFFKVGAVLYGSGYVLLALLRGELVERLGWLTEAQLLDAIAVGQGTPGPVFTTATFIGYLLGGGLGAAVATVGIFLPAFLFVAVSARLVSFVRASPVASSFLDGVSVASVGLMAIVTWQLARAAVVDAPTALLLLGASALLIWRRASPTALLAAGAAVGLALGALGVG